MRRKSDLSELQRLLKMVRENPRRDFDDDIFYTLCRACQLGKSIFTKEMVKENYGKKYIRAYLFPDGKAVALKDFLLAFLDKYLELDGFMLDDLIIEKGFVEEIISQLDTSTMTAVADDISSYETEAAIIREDNLPLYPGIQSWNAESVLTVPRVEYGDGKDAKTRLAGAYKSALDKAFEAGYRNITIAPLSDYPLGEEGNIASSLVNVYFSLHPQPAYITFVLPNQDEVRSFLS